MNHPDPKKHLQISLIKSAMRVAGYICLLVSPISGVSLLILAEVMGILEELV